MISGHANSMAGGRCRCLTKIDNSFDDYYIFYCVSYSRLPIGRCQRRALRRCFPRLRTYFLGFLRYIFITPIYFLHIKHWYILRISPFDRFRLIFMPYFINLFHDIICRRLPVMHEICWLSIMRYAGVTPPACFYLFHYLLLFCKYRYTMLQICLEMTYFYRR